MTFSHPVICKYCVRACVRACVRVTADRIPVTGYSLHAVDFLPDSFQFVMITFKLAESVFCEKTGQILTCIYFPN